MVAEAEAGLEHAGVAALALLVDRRHLLDQVLHRRRAVQRGERLPAVVQRLGLVGRGQGLLAQGDDLLGVAARLLGLGQGGGDAAMLEQRGDHVAHQREAVLAGAAQFAVVDAVSHGFNPILL